MSELQHGDRVVCIAAAGERLPGVVLHVFRDGRLLVDVGTGKRNKQGEPDRDVRAFDAEMVKKA